MQCLLQASDNELVDEFFYYHVGADMEIADATNGGANGGELFRAHACKPCQ